ncbi:MAG TPA: glycosyltransferase family 1 protein [Syntrophorhabdaceae bacterium]|nr:glycosyltransferase family 1 protein [Syntrophorhabdaceae bacterium]
MKIAVVFEGVLHVGGGYQQQLSVFTRLGSLDNKYEITAFVFSEENKKVLKRYNVKTVLVKKTLLDKIHRFLHRQHWFFRFSKSFRLKTLFEKKLKDNNVDLVYFLSPSGLSLDLIEHNYIITVWDLCHRDFLEFPEVNYYREFELREQLYLKALKKAVAVLVDSEPGKENIVRRYGIDDSRIFVAPFTPSINIYLDNNLDVKTKYKINGEYIYYPAQFWSHKNHVYIIDALSILMSQGFTLTAVFSGSDKGNLKYVMNYAKKMGVEDLIKYIGFAPNEEIYSLYKNSIALVMPTYFGPTNIPPLEAFSIGVPVIYSDLKGLKEQVGDAALLCDLSDPNSLATHLKNLLESEKLRINLIEKGKQKLKELSRYDILETLDTIFTNYSIKMKCWKY